jgi:NAD(P)-dependent dehydrogenase (short-subunit alcohol dehydrogenase family)
MGKYVIVGASQGIGESIAAALLKDGHEVINFSRNPSALPGVVNHNWDALGTDDSAVAAITGPLDGIAYCPGSINLKPFNR